MSESPRISVVLPVYNQADHIRSVVEGHLAALTRVPDATELVLVPNGCRDDSEAVCRALAAAHPSVRVVPSARGGWGLAVQTGLAAARGELLCYTNSARTEPEELTLMLLYAVAYPRTVVKANRKIREQLAPAPRVAALQSRVPGPLRPVLLGRQRHAEGLSPQLRPAAHAHPGRRPDRRRVLHDVPA